jgi:hypothetical protein
MLEPLQSLINFRGTATDVGHHGDGAMAREVALEEPRQLAVPVRNKLLAFSAHINVISNIKALFNCQQQKNSR